MQSKLDWTTKANVYVISHGRAERTQRPTTILLDNAGVDYYITMSDSQVDDYVKNGVARDKIVVAPDEWANEYMMKHRTFKIDGFNGAVPNREMCNIHAREHGKKYAFQLDDNIINLFIDHRGIKKSDVETYADINEWLSIMVNIAESTNIGLLGLELGATPARDKRIVRNGYAYSFFLENVQADIHWLGPFDDDVTHNLDFNHSMHYTNAVLTAFGYGKESKSNTGMRKAYDKFEAERPMGVANLYPDHVKVGVKPKANGTGKRFYHVFTGRLHQNIRVKDKALFTETINETKQVIKEYREHLNG